MSESTNTNLHGLAILGNTSHQQITITSERPSISDGDIAAVVETLKERALSIFSSPRVASFEREFADFHNVKFAIAVNSGTAALQATIAALSIGCGDEVILPAYSYAATLNSVLLQGAKPVFVDVCPNSFVLDGSDIQELENVRSERTRALIVVDLFGNPVARTEILKWCEKHNIALIEDCAQSTGAYYDNKRVGSFGIGCHSFGEIKNITAAEGGMITTNDAEVARRARLMRHAGEAWRTLRTSTIGPSPTRLTELINGIDYEFVGANFRMNALQAALGNSQLGRLDELNAQRVFVANKYIERLIGLPSLRLMEQTKNATPVFNRFAISITDSCKISRDAFIACLLHEGIPAGVYYPLTFDKSSVILNRTGFGRSACPIDCLRSPNAISSNDLSGAAQAASTHILLPCYPGMTAVDIDFVLQAVGKVAVAATNKDLVDSIESATRKTSATYFGQFFMLN